MKSVNMRGGTEESLSGAEIEPVYLKSTDGSDGCYFSSPIGAEFWPQFLLAVAKDTNCSQAFIAKCVKAAKDFGIEILDGDEDEDSPEYKALMAVVNEQALWNTLPSLKKKYKEKRVLDRRFDGPKHLRTRDFSDYDDDGDEDDGVDGLLSAIFPGGVNTPLGNSNLMMMMLMGQMLSRR